MQSGYSSVCCYPPKQLLSLQAPAHTVSQQHGCQVASLLQLWSPQPLLCLVVIGGMGWGLKMEAAPLQVLPSQQGLPQHTGKLHGFLAASSPPKGLTNFKNLILI